MLRTGVGPVRAAMSFAPPRRGLGQDASTRAFPPGSGGAFRARTRGPGGEAGEVTMSSDELTVEEILSWADAFRTRAGRWPSPHSGPIPETKNEETWSGVNEALRHGRRGMPGG